MLSRLPSPRDRLIAVRSGPVELFCVITLTGALITIAAGAMTEAAFFLATLAALLIVRRLELPPAFEFAFAIGVLLQGWGNGLLLFELIGWYDKAVHFLTPMLVVPSLYLLLVRVGALAPLWGNRLRRPTVGVFVVSLALGTALAAIWELVEGTADRWLGTSLAHGYFETIDDLYSSLLGSLAGAAIIAWLVAARRRDLTDEPSAAEAVAERA